MTRKIYKVKDMYYLVDYDEEENYSVKSLDEYVIENCKVLDKDKTIKENIELQKQKMIEKLEKVEDELFMDIFEQELITVQENFGVYIGVALETDFDRNYEGAMVEMGNYAVLLYLDENGNEIGG